MLLKKDIYNVNIKDIEDIEGYFKDYQRYYITNLAINTTLNARINEVKNKIPNITNLATTTALTAVENEIPDYSKYITAPDFAKLIFCKVSTSKDDITNSVKKDLFL